MDLSKNRDIYNLWMYYRNNEKETLALNAVSEHRINFIIFIIFHSNEEWALEHGPDIICKGTQVWNWVRNCAWDSRGIKRSPIPFEHLENKRKNADICKCGNDNRF